MQVVKSAKPINRKDVYELEQRRYKELLKYNVLDTEREPQYDDLTNMAMKICGTPIALITFVDYANSRVFAKSYFGYNGDPSMFFDDLTQSFCYHSTRPNTLFLIEDASKDEVLQTNPYVANNGVRFYAGAPITVPSGEVLGNLCVIDTKPRDLSEFQQDILFKLAKQVVSQLELRLRLHELVKAKNELLEQNRELEKLNREKNSFVGMISHDIRQPLGNIMLSCELILQEGDPSNNKHEDVVQTIHASAGLMHNLVDDLLQMVKIDFGRLPVELDKRAIDVARLIHKTVVMNSLFAARKNINIIFSIKTSKSNDTSSVVIPYDKWENDRGSITCFIDPSKIEQVINNLLSNAVKFSHPGTIVEVFLEKNLPSNQLIISVSDHGQGIPEDDLKKMFTPFQKLSVKPTAGESSNSLGLCIVKSIIEAHKGTISVESKVGKGTTFSIALPLAQPFIAPTPEKSPTETHMALQGPAPKVLRVLIAEDNIINQRLVSQILKKRGHESDIASDGIEALTVFERNGGHDTYDALLIDEEMPRMKGAELVEKIRQMERTKRLKRIPLISVSGYTSEDHVAKMKSIGVDYCLSKPFQVQKLINAVESLSFGTEL